MSKSKEFNKLAIDNLGYYVYLYSDPDTKQPFYIGKGKGNRCFNHLFQTGESNKIAKIHEIQRLGKNPIIEILVHGVDEETALKVEAAAIDLIGIDNLTNVQKGYHSSVYGRIDVDDINLRFGCENLSKSDIIHNVIMIRINKAYHHGMSDYELYEATRGVWHVNLEKANRAEYAFSIYDGMIMEVYKIAHWFEANSTMRNYPRPKGQESKVKQRYEFVGNLADEEIRKRYVGKIISSLFSPGNQNPIMYILGRS